jgi:hypothetical protein
MAYTSLTFEHPGTNEIREAPVGFSWTVFFFGFFPPLFRSDFKNAIIIFLVNLITFGLSNLVFMFIYNKMHIKTLIGNGFKVASSPYPDLDELGSKLGISLPRLEVSAPPPPQ